MEYTFVEYSDMHLMYGLAECNSLRAQGLYADKSPNRHLPNSQTFQRIDQRLRETGSVMVMPNMGRHGGVPRTVRTVEVDENILDAVAEDPTVSVRNVVQEFQVSKCTVNNILREQLIHPYDVQKVQGLSPSDYPTRVQFCTWLLEKFNQDNEFTALILFSDEAGFCRDGPINSHNLHIYADENPHGVRQTRRQVQLQINLWAGVIGHYLIGPTELPPRLNVQRYLQFLDEQLH